jgi:aryl-alcohol dehydrogenase-like predicted oxidoreductase
MVLRKRRDPTLSPRRPWIAPGDRKCSLLWDEEKDVIHSLEVAELMREIGARHGRSAGEVSIARTLRHPAVTGAIVGARNAGQVDGFAGALAFRLSESEIAEIDAILPESISLIELS